MNTFVPRVRSVPQQEMSRAPPSVLIACVFTLLHKRARFSARSRPDHVHFIHHARTSHGIVKLDGIAIELFRGGCRVHLGFIIHVTHEISRNLDFITANSFILSYSLP